MQWFLTSNNEEVRKYVRDSTGKENYEDEYIATGSNSAYSVNNIYDMAGNYWEWTMTVINEEWSYYGNDCGRAVCGGGKSPNYSYDHKNTGGCASARSYWNLTIREFLGSRLTLVI